MCIAHDLENFFAYIRRAVRKYMINRPTDHHSDKLVFCNVGDHAVANKSTITKDRVAVGNAEYFIKLMADKQDSLTLRL